MTIFLYTRKAEIIDGLIELFIQIVHRLSTKAEKKVVKTLINDFKKVYGKNTILMQIADVTLKYPDGKMKDVIYPIASKQTLSDIIKEYKISGTGYKNEIYNIIRSSYSNHYRRMVPKILESLEFRTNNQDYKPVLDALDWIKSYKDSKQQYYEITEELPTKEILRAKWYDTVIEKDEKGIEKINKMNYEILVLQALREKLRCKEIWVKSANKYRNPDDDLPKDFDNKKDFYYSDLGVTTDSQVFVDNLKSSLCNALKNFNDSVLNNDKVKLIADSKKRNRFISTNRTTRIKKYQ
jgi:DNA-binding cell septation regulator SpoVG